MDFVSKENLVPRSSLNHDEQGQKVSSNMLPKGIRKVLGVKP
jgi:hypothetical protein